MGKQQRDKAAEGCEPGELMEGTLPAPFLWLSDSVSLLLQGSWNLVVRATTPQGRKHLVTCLVVALGLMAYQLHTTIQRLKRDAATAHQRVSAALQNGKLIKAEADGVRQTHRELYDFLRWRVQGLRDSSAWAVKTEEIELELSELSAVGSPKITPLKALIMLIMDEFEGSLDDNERFAELCKTHTE